MENKERAALYERVSTLEQALEGYSLGAQDEKLTKHAEYKGYEIFGRYVDDGFSGSSLNRPAVQRLMRDINGGAIDVVLIYKLDRLSRRVKDVLELVELFEKKNVVLYSLTENIDLSSPFGRAALKMAATFSELERENIIERTAMGRNAKIKSGYYSCHGRPPFGYDFDKAAKAFSVNTEQADIVRDIFNRYIGGMSLAKINEYCLLKYKLPCFKNESITRSIIRRSVYAGYIADNGRLIPVKNIEPIISLDTYLKARDSAKTHAAKRTRDSSPYLLSGLLYCGKCGEGYIGKRRNFYITENGVRALKYSYETYGCAARLKSGRNYKKASCDNRIINAAELDELIDKFVNNLTIADINEEGVKDARISKVTSEIDYYENKRERLLDLYMDSVIDKSAYLSRVDEINDIIDGLRAAIKNQNDCNRGSDAENALKYLKALHAAYPYADKNEKRRLLKLIINKIVVADNNITFDLKIKISKSR